MRDKSQRSKAKGKFLVVCFIKSYHPRVAVCINSQMEVMIDDGGHDTHMQQKTIKYYLL